ncbi:site-determining protein [Kordiimonas sediminis]|uniref:Site-determining protein n=1 Tax=Kordiimonas sediminis TaxID=1735581 RepID=A0A919ARN2_9PROT|nr:MinD/ParA family protein [Kordiimonas sediminis]GHF22559.1 site-determining protein [Kordiimonas sediminis]
MTANTLANSLNEHKLITIASGKGGVGKTWCSVTLAHTLARSGRKVLLFDGDLGLANIDIQLGLMPKKDIGDFISGDASLAEIVTRYDDKGGSFDVLPGKSGSGALGSLSKDTLLAIRNGLINLAENYDHVLLDLSAGIDSSVITLSRHKGKLLVIMTADPTSLTDAYAFVKVINMRDKNADMSIIVNNVGSKREGEKAYEAIKRACEGFLKISPPLAGIIKSDTRVVDAIRAQVPLMSRHPQADAAQDMTKIAAGIIGR